MQDSRYRHAGSLIHINMQVYNHMNAQVCVLFIMQVVAPKRAALADANKRLDGANKKLTGIRAKVKELKDRVASLEDSLMKVLALSQACFLAIIGRADATCLCGCCAPAQGSAVLTCTLVLSATQPASCITLL